MNLYDWRWNAPVYCTGSDPRSLEGLRPDLLVTDKGKTVLKSMTVPMCEHTSAIFMALEKPGHLPLFMFAGNLN